MYNLVEVYTYVALNKYSRYIYNIGEDKKKYSPLSKYFRYMYMHNIGEDHRYSLLSKYSRYMYNIGEDKRYSPLSKYSRYSFTWLFLYRSP